jgi:chromosome segregation ATPase
MSDDARGSQLRLLMPPTNVNVFPEDWLPKQTAELSTEALVSLHVAVLRKIYSRIDGLKAARDQARQERDVAGERLEESAQRVAILSDSNATLAGQIRALNETVHRMSEDYARVNNTRVSLEKQLQTVANELKVADRKINKLKADADSAGEYIRGLTDEGSDLRQKVAVVQQERDQAVNLQKALISDLAAAQHQNTALVEQVRVLQEEAAKDVLRMEGHKADVNRLVNERTELLGRITVLNRKLNVAAHDQPRTAEEQDVQLRQFVQDLAGKQPPLEQPKSVPLDREVTAMNEVLAALLGLDPMAQDATLSWIGRRLERDRQNSKSRPF